MTRRVKLPKARPHPNVIATGQVPGYTPANLTIATDASLDMQSKRVGLGWISNAGHWGVRGHRYPYADPGETTIAELRAVAYAWERIRPAGPVTILTDSDDARIQLDTWRGGDPAMPPGYRAAYRADGDLSALQTLAQIIAGHPDLTVTWIRGHTGHPLNEAADSLARLGYRGRLSNTEARASAATMAAARLADITAGR